MPPSESPGAVTGPGMAQPTGLQEALSRFAETGSAPADVPASRLEAVRAFQVTGLRRRHGDHPVVGFFAEQMLSGVDLGGLENEPAANAGRLRRLLGDTDAAAAAVEFAALTAELDGALAARIDDAPLTPVAYVRAYRAVGRAADRERQLGLVAFVADDLSGVAQSRMSYMAFRMAKRPAHMAGFGAFYNLLASGFKALRSDRRVEQRIGEWLAAEHALVARLLD